ETLADAGITGSKFARFLQRDLLPKAREMQDAKWAGDAGTDQRDICVSHSIGFVNLASANCKFLPECFKARCHVERSETSQISSCRPFRPEMIRDSSLRSE